MRLVRLCIEPDATAARLHQAGHSFSSGSIFRCDQADQASRLEHLVRIQPAPAGVRESDQAQTQAGRIEPDPAGLPIFSRLHQAGHTVRSGLVHRPDQAVEVCTIHRRDVGVRGVITGAARRLSNSQFTHMQHCPRSSTNACSYEIRRPAGGVPPPPPSLGAVTPPPFFSAP